MFDDRSEQLLYAICARSCSVLIGTPLVFAITGAGCRQNAPSQLSPTTQQRALHGH